MRLGVSPSGLGEVVRLSQRARRGQGALLEVWEGSGVLLRGPEGFAVPHRGPAGIGGHFWRVGLGWEGRRWPVGVGSPPEGSGGPSGEPGRVRQSFRGAVRVSGVPGKAESLSCRPGRGQEALKEGQEGSAGTEAVGSPPRRNRMIGRLSRRAEGVGSSSGWAGWGWEGLRET